MVLTVALLPGSILRALRRRRFLGAGRGGGKMRTPLACISASCVQSGGSGTLQRDSAYSSATASGGGVACSTARLLRYSASNQAGGGWYLVGCVSESYMLILKPKLKSIDSGWVKGGRRQ